MHSFLFAVILAGAVHPGGAEFSPVWSWPAAQGMFRDILGSDNVSECAWSMPAGPSLASPSATGRILNGFGICAASIETCIHIGAVPRPTTPAYHSGNCTVCCSRSTCTTPYNDTQPARNGYCMLPKVIPVVEGSNSSVELESAEALRAAATVTFEAYQNSVGLDDEDKTCLAVGGYISGWWSGDAWWSRQCPMSGRCCLYPDTGACQTCGAKYGKPWNWSKPTMARSDTRDELLAWKTAVNQMAGTGWNFGMTPMATPGQSDSYSQTPPTYDSLVPPQLWNNFLNRPKKGDDGDDDDDDDDHRGWCWQAAILSKLDGSLRCGGALISDRYILTTATCAHFTSDTYANYGVRLGGTDLSKGNEKHAVDVDIGGVFIHPNYNSSTGLNNIAIIGLAYSVPCNSKYICTICLPSVNMMGFPNFTIGTAHEQWIKDDVYQCLATGWGRKTAGVGSYTPYLKEMVYAPIFHNQTYCGAEYTFRVGSSPFETYSNTTFCAVPQPSYQGKVVPVCQADNGGPLACFYDGQYYLAGLSWGGSRCDLMHTTDLVAKMLQPNRKPGISGSHADFFTDVVKFIPWIYGVIYRVNV